MTDPQRSELLDDAEFQSILAACIEKLEQGETLDHEAIARQNPKYAEPLREFLDDHQRLMSLAANVQKRLPRGDTERPIDSSSAQREIVAGETIQYVGEYEILGEIARGGMGVVYQAQQRQLKRVVALKMILAGRLADSAEVQRFRREAQAIARLKHPSIVTVHEVGEFEGHHYFVMDFVDGQSLADVLREESLPPPKAAAIVKTVAEAIHYAHQQGTLHRDIKPANILLDPRRQQGNSSAAAASNGRSEPANRPINRPAEIEFEPKITDFGLAKIIESDEEKSSELTATGQILGTPSFMSPEQASGRRSLVGPATDIYALAAVLYACIAGRAPFIAESPVDTLMQVVSREPVSPRLLNPAVPQDLETICLKCLAKEPHRRYGTAAQLANDLGRFLEGRPVSARPIGPMAKSWRWCRRNPVVASLLCLVALSMMLGTAVSTYFAIEESRRAAAEAAARQDAVDARNAEAKQRAEAVRLAGVAQEKQQQAETAERRAEERRREAQEAQRLAERRAEQVRRQLYAAQMSLAQLAWEDNDVSRMLQLLEHSRPQEGEQDLRGFEWHYLWRLAHGARPPIDAGKSADD